MKRLVVSKSNEIVRIATRLSLIEHRFLATCLGKIFKDNTITADTEFLVNIEEFSKLFSIDRKVAYREFKKIATGLVGKQIYFPEFDLPEITVLTSWVNVVKFNDTKEFLLVKFAEEIIPHISQLKGNFICYDVKDIVVFSSPYTIRLFELLKSYNHTRDRFQYLVDVDELKRLIGIDKGYDLYSQLKRLLVLSLNEINNSSELKVQMFEKKDGKKVVRILFKLGE